VKFKSLLVGFGTGHPLFECAGAQLIGRRLHYLCCSDADVTCRHGRKILIAINKNFTCVARSTLICHAQMKI